MPNLSQLNRVSTNDNAGVKAERKAADESNGGSFARTFESAKCDRKSDQNVQRQLRRSEAPESVETHRIARTDTGCSRKDKAKVHTETNKVDIAASHVADSGLVAVPLVPVAGLPKVTRYDANVRDAMAMNESTEPPTEVGPVEPSPSLQVCQVPDPDSGRTAKDLLESDSGQTVPAIATANLADIFTVGKVVENNSTASADVGPDANREPSDAQPGVAKSSDQNGPGRAVSQLPGNSANARAGKSAEATTCVADLEVSPTSHLNASDDGNQRSVRGQEIVQGRNGKDQFAERDSALAGAAKSGDTDFAMLVQPGLESARAGDDGGQGGGKNTTNDATNFGGEGFGGEGSGNAKHQNGLMENADFGSMIASEASRNAVTVVAAPAQMHSGSIVARENAPAHAPEDTTSPSQNAGDAENPVWDPSKAGLPVQGSEPVSRGELHLAMQTDRLGNVELHARIVGEQIGAAITVERKDAHAVIATELPALQQSLSEKQLRVEQLSLVQGFAGSDSRGADQSFQQNSGTQQPGNRYGGYNARGYGSAEENTWVMGTTAAAEIFDSMGRLSVHV